jgi:Sulfotransferase domain
MLLLLRKLRRAFTLPGHVIRELAAIRGTLADHEGKFTQFLEEFHTQLARSRQAVDTQLQPLLYLHQQADRELADIKASLAQQDNRSDEYRKEFARLQQSIETRLRHLLDLHQRTDEELVATKASLVHQEDRSAALQKEIDSQLVSLRQSTETQLQRLFDSTADHNKTFADFLEEFDAQLAYIRDPGDLGAAMHLIRLRLKVGKELPDDIHENALRLQLRINPYDLPLTRSLVALLYRRDRPPIPDPAPRERPRRKLDHHDIDALVSLANAHAHADELFSELAALWQICVRFPGDARGWAEYARSFAGRHEWAYCRLAAQRALELGARPNAATADALLEALSALAEHGRMADLDWRPWFEKLPDSQRVNAYAIRLLVVTDRKLAVTLAPQLLRRHPERAETLLAASMVAFEQEHMSDSYDYLRQALELAVATTLATVARDWSAPFSILLDATGKSDELARWFADLPIPDSELILIPSCPSPGARLMAQRQRREALERQLPPSLFIPLYKTASITVHSILASGFRLPMVLYSLNDLRVVTRWLKDYMRGGAAQAVHLWPTPENIDLLVAGGVKSVIVHVRDPRQVLISALEHRVLYPREFMPSMRGVPKVGDLKKTDIATIQKLLAPTIAWIEGWITARDRLNVHFTTFEEFVRDQTAFVDRLLALYGGDTRYFDRVAALRQSPAIDYHRRRGAIDEWRQVLDVRQIKRVNSQIPESFWSLFGWSP